MSKLVHRTINHKLIALILLAVVALLIASCSPSDFPYDGPECWSAITTSSGYTCGTPPDGTNGWTENSDGTWTWWDIQGWGEGTPGASSDCGTDITYNYFTGVYQYICGADHEKSGPPYTGIHLLGSSDEYTLYTGVPNAAGETPCGVFNVNGWGRKYIGMADFPACTAPVTVMCFTVDGAWTADTVSDVVMQGDYEVDFTSSQDGICGLFSQ